MLKHHLFSVGSRGENWNMMVLIAAVCGATVVVIVIVVLMYRSRRRHDLNQQMLKGENISCIELG